MVAAKGLDEVDEVLDALEGARPAQAAVADAVRGGVGRIPLRVEPPVVGQVSGAEEVHQAEHQEAGIERGEHAEVVAVARERDAVDVVVKEHADPVLDDGAGDEGDPERQGHQQREEGRGQQQQAAVGERRRVPARQHAREGRV